jgi:YidC/Oxa1 family membrane protein insertase
MDNQRLLVWATFGILLWFTYQTWIQDYGPAPVPATPPADTDTEQLPADTADDQLTLPELGEVGGETGQAAATLPGSEPAEPTAESAIITVRTDVLELQISTRGGTLVRATLLGYPVEKDRPNELVELLSPERSNLGLIRAGLRSTAGASADQDSVFASPQSEYVLGEADAITVPLTWTNESGVTIEKRFLFTRGSYTIGVEQTLVNNSSEPWRGDQYTQLLRRSKGIDRSMFDVDSYSFDGPQTYNGDKAEKHKRDDLQEKGPVEFSTPDGWVAAIQHHFLSAIIPEAGAPHVYRVDVKGDTMIASVVGVRRPEDPVAAGGAARQTEADRGLRLADDSFAADVLAARLHP